MAQINQADDSRLVAIQLLMDEAGRVASFYEFDPFAERHGSWQRTIYAWSAPDGLDRYLIAAVTSLDDGEEIAVMAGAEERCAADNGRPRFRRFDVGSIRLDGDDLNLSRTGDIRKLLEAVRMAVEIHFGWCNFR